MSRNDCRNSFYASTHGSHRTFPDSPTQSEMSLFALGKKKLNTSWLSLLILLMTLAFTLFWCPSSSVFGVFLDHLRLTFLLWDTTVCKLYQTASFSSVKYLYLSMGWQVLKQDRKWVQLFLALLRRQLARILIEELFYEEGYFQVTHQRLLKRPQGNILLPTFAFCFPILQLTKKIEFST